MRERYSPKPAPECHICGKEMTIQRMSASRITYGCTGATYDDKGCHYADGRSIADDHYEQSRVTVVDVSDPDVLALLDELEHYKSREERVTKLVLDNSTSWDALYKKLEAAEKRIAEQREYYEGVIADGSKRIAELEARTVTVKLYDDFQLCHYGATDDYAKGYIDCQNIFTKWLAAAGIKVKGE
ncbi:ead/Ea22-like family protein [Salmonella enterica subsp. enterica]|nr:ead/Ea22-like family protein [Salmonella enterica subsp. enterica]EBP0028292.1 ead/Ea22-like family protein [Salmonella enterica]